MTPLVSMPTVKLWIKQFVQGIEIRVWHILHSTPALDLAYKIMYAKSFRIKETWDWLEISQKGLVLDFFFCPLLFIVQVSGQAFKCFNLFMQQLIVLDLRSLYNQVKSNVSIIILTFHCLNKFWFYADSNSRTYLNLHNYYKTLG